MNYISVSYACKYRLKFATNYWWTACGKCYNTKRGKLIKQVYNSGCLGYNINGKFYSLTKLKSELELIPETECPF
jgi:hypothetical protein